MDAFLQSESTRKRLEEMRRSLRPWWSATEAGGIYLLASATDDAANLSAFSRLLTMFPDIEEKAGDKVDDKWLALAERATPIVHSFFLEASLAPGVYRIENDHAGLAEDGKLMLNLWDEAAIELPEAPAFDFTVTEQHLTLMRRMNTRPYGAFIEIMDCKRPYGDMTYFHLDMAEALGETPERGDGGRGRYSDDVEQRYNRLHAEMLFAVQAFWKHATIDA